MTILFGGGQQIMHANKMHYISVCDYCSFLPTLIAAPNSINVSISLFLNLYFPSPFTKYCCSSQSCYSLRSTFTGGTRDGQPNPMVLGPCRCSDAKTATAEYYGHALCCILWTLTQLQEAPSEEGDVCPSPSPG